ncbi:MAG: acetylornithine deacetylase [Rhodanobacter sp.]
MNRQGVTADPPAGEALLQATLAHLRALVGFDTRNPPRAIDGGGIFDYLRAQLPGFVVSVTDHGAGAVALHAVRGRPRLLFNVHVDTVPDSPAWTADPHTLRISGDRAIGLGACDIKGAAAALLAVANATDRDMALLFSSDEEGNNPRCVADFLTGTCDYAAVIVAEPTQARAVLAHRGILSARLGFAGRAGHASAEQAAADSALHQVVRWGNAALDFVEGHAQHGFGELKGLRFNIGAIQGGIKANMIAPAAELRFGCRPLPNMDPDQLLERFRTLVQPCPGEFTATFRGAALPAGEGTHAEERRLLAQRVVDELGIPVGAAVDFWTEAALFSAAGLVAFVYGPGDIGQAHSADEWVALEQLQQYAASIYRIVQRGQA